MDSLGARKLSLDKVQGAFIIKAALGGYILGNVIKS